jgi:hypothetical protein
MTYESYIKARLMDYVIVDAYASGGVEPMLAVAQVLKNRANAGWSGGDWIRIIESAPEYRGTVQPDMHTHLDPRDGSFRELMRRIDDVYYGTAEDSNVNTSTGKSLYYAELHNINREWFRERILSDLETHPRIAVVGQLTFFG